jgi:ABC-2 type transport system permease protein
MTAFVALLRRELWEHRSLIIVPLVLAGLVLSGSLYGLVRGTSLIGAAAHSSEIEEALGDPRADQIIAAGYLGFSAVFGCVLFVVVLLYLADCLYADRRDRSILFWKSLPVSDTATVLSKLATGLVVAPALTLVIAFATTILIAIMGTIALSVWGISGASVLWSPLPILQSMLTVPAIGGLILLWYAPVAAWFVLASAFAPRAPLMWTALPPLALIVLEQVTLQTTRFAEFLGERMSAVYPRIFNADEFAGYGVRDGAIMITRPALSDVFAYLTSLDVWGGVAVAAVFTVAAIALRRYRDET